MLQTLPNELILAIASYATPEAKGKIAQTCRTCYSVMMPLLWRYLPLKAIENVDGLVNRLVHNNWFTVAKQFVHSISFSSDSVRHHALEETQNLIGVMESGYTYLFDNMHPPAPPTLKPLAKKTFGDAVLDLIQHFPQTSYLSFDYYLVLPYLITNQSLPSSNQITTDTRFTGTLTISHYRPGQVHALGLFLAPFPQLSELSIQAQAALSFSDDKGAWLINDADILQLSALPMDHLRHLTIKDVDDNVKLDTYRTLLDSKPNLQSLTLQWRYLPTTSYMKAFVQLVDTIPGCYLIRIGSNACLTHK